MNLGSANCCLTWSRAGPLRWDILLNKVAWVLNGNGLQFCVQSAKMVILYWLPADIVRSLLVDHLCAFRCAVVPHFPPSAPLSTLKWKPCCSGVPFCYSVFLLKSCAHLRTCVSHGSCLPSLFALEMTAFGWAAGQRKTCFLFDFRRLFCLLGGNQWFMVLWLLTSGHRAFWGKWSAMTQQVVGNVILESWCVLTIDLGMV